MTEVETPLFADAPVAAAELTVHVVDEGALLAVFEEVSHDAGATWYDRGHHLDHGPDTPLLVLSVLHAITEPQEEPLLSVEQRRHPSLRTYPIDGENATLIARFAAPPLTPRTRP